MIKSINITNNGGIDFYYKLILETFNEKDLTDIKHYKSPDVEIGDMKYMTVLDGFTPTDFRLLRDTIDKIIAPKGEQSVAIVVHIPRGNDCDECRFLEHLTDTVYCNLYQEDLEELCCYIEKCPQCKLLKGI